MEVIAFVAGVLGCFSLFYWFVPRFLNRFGLKMQLVPVDDEPDDCDGSDDFNEPEGDSENPGDNPGMVPVMSGKCRSCGLFHVGLTPASVILGPLPGHFTVPNGVPPVCARCWVKINPQMATNVISLADAGIPDSVGTGRDNVRLDRPHHRGHPAPNGDGSMTFDVKEIDPIPKNMDFTETKSKTRPMSDQDVDNQTRERLLKEPGGKLTEEELKAAGEKFKDKAFAHLEKQQADAADKMTDEELERATRPDADAPKEQEVKCDKCGATRGIFKPLFQNKTPTGKHWCQACVDQLGGPGDKRPKRRRRGE